MARPIQDEFKSKSKWSRRGAAELLQRHGLAFDVLLRRDIASTYSACTGDVWFIPAAVQSLVWSRHAMTNERSRAPYIEECRHCMCDEHRPLDAVLKYAGRFGPDGLARSLEGYRTIFAGWRALFDPPPSSPQDLLANQKRIMDAVQTGVTPDGAKRSIHGIGPWLGFAPHKIHLIWQESWWEDASSDDMYQPLGSVAGKGIRELAKAGVIDESKARGLQLDDDENDGVSGFGTALLAHSLTRELAGEVAGTRVMHVNSGLYELGYRGN